MNDKKQKGLVRLANLGIILLCISLVLTGMNVMQDGLSRGVIIRIFRDFLLIGLFWFSKKKFKKEKTNKVGHGENEYRHL